MAQPSDASMAFALFALDHATDSGRRRRWPARCDGLWATSQRVNNERALRYE
jgi:hypothetical protein